jgi:hypothetical protein
MASTRHEYLLPDNAYPDLSKPVHYGKSDLWVRWPAGFPRIYPFWPAGYPDSCSALVSGGGSAHLGTCNLSCIFIPLYSTVSLLSLLLTPLLLTPLLRHPRVGWVAQWALHAVLVDVKNNVLCELFGRVWNSAQCWMWCWYHICHSVSKII